MQALLVATIGRSSAVREAHCFVFRQPLLGAALFGGPNWRLLRRGSHKFQYVEIGCGDLEQDGFSCCQINVRVN